MTPLDAAVLGLLQGLTEFLPVSSSGHLVLGEALLGVRTGDITFEMIVHFGTLLAVVTALRERVWALVRGCLKGESGAWWMVWMFGIGTVPAAAAGVFFEDAVEVAFSDPRAACGWLVVTGAVLWSTRFRQGSRKQVRGWDAVWVGMAQAFAVLPGVSRSGMTISTGIWRGVTGREAAMFSFLLSVPVILGGTVLKVGEMAANPPAWDAVLPLLVGAAVAYASGVAAIRWLLAMLKGGRLHPFAYYCWAVGLLGLVYFWG